jgi:hypothetical protein
VSGRFGLRATPGGLGTPAFGDDGEVIRISGDSLVREIGARRTQISLQGATLRDLAAFVAVDLDTPFSVGEDAPPLGDPDAPVHVEGRTTHIVAEWYDLAWRVLDDIVAGMPPSAEPATIQIWPEHFDAATHVGVPSGERVNLGFSPGDRYEPEPYLYVGPWSAKRPGDPDYWNAPFGALRRASEVVAAADRFVACREFFAAGVRNASED